ncbi:MAG: hypothetical protein A2252_10405 [Elusimicrobia bacterium RIFOXYA2_FULL_39_19]|nr:MAG: hypothetical protein A2252_10405 [Elusimicrobia bacterium RIFOXYA2_FULL_39_19]
MKCEMGRIERYVSGDISPDASILISKHIKNCKDCFAYCNTLKQLGRLSKSVKIMSVSPDFTEKVFSKIPQKPAPEKENAGFFFFVRWGVIFASLLVITASLFLKEDNKNIKVKFFVVNNDAQKISLAGDFNKWNVDAHKLAKNGNAWYVEVKLKPGRYQYMFVIDGNKWVPDETAMEYVYDGFNQKNSIIDTTKI